MKAAEAKRTSVTRRSFIGGASVAAASTLVLNGCAPKTLSNTGEDPASVAPEAPAEEKKIVTSIGNCGGHCALEATMREGRLVGLDRWSYEDSDENRENICQRCLSHIYRLYSERRILYPMRRVGERGAGEFERISWEEAIDEICSKWKSYRAEFGDGAVAMFGGSGSHAADSSSDWGAGIPGYSTRFLSYLHAPKIALNADMAGMRCMGGMMGAGLSVYGNDWGDLINADNIIVWGCNPSESNVARFRHITQAKAAGATLTVIDPNFTITASKADRFISIRPGSDGLLAIAVMRHLIANDLVDQEVVREKTVGPFLVKDNDGMYLRMSDLGRVQPGAEDDVPVVANADGEVGPAGTVKEALLADVPDQNGISVHTAYELLVDRVMNSEWTQEQILEYTDLAQEDVDEVIRLVTTGKTMVITSYGPDHYTNGHTFYQNMLAMLMLSGNVGKHGAGIVGSDVSMLSPMYGGNPAAINEPADAPGVYAVVPANNFEDVLKTGKFGDQDMVVKSIYVQASNILNNQANRLKWEQEILPQIEFLVVADIETNDTTRYADMLLPVAHWWETERFWGIEGYAMVSEKVQEPAGESKGDLEILNLLLEGMGLGEACLTRDEFMSQCFENDACREAGLTWESLKEQKCIKTTPEGYLHVNGEKAEDICTEVGRFIFYREGCRPDPDIPGQSWDYDKERLPYWMPPSEAWFNSEAAGQYPLHFMTERGKFSVHSNFAHCENLLEINPEPIIAISPVDAASRGIKSDDYVRVRNDRGSCVAKARINAGNRPGIVQIDHGWGWDQFKEGHYQNLTSYVTGNVYSNNCYHECMVEVELA